MIARKQQACLRCFRGRRRCEFPPGAKQCHRCSSLGKPCIPRVSQRIIGAGGEADDAAAAKDTSDQSAVLKKLMDTVINGGLREQLVSAATWAQLYNAQENASEDMMRAVINASLIRGWVARCPARLHAATAMSMACRIPVDPSSIIRLRHLPPLVQDQDLWSLVHRKMFEPDSAGVCGLLARFRRCSAATPLWEKLFYPANELEHKFCEMDGRIPHIFREASSDSAAVDAITFKLFQLACAAKPIPRYEYALMAEISSDEPVTFADKNGAKYSGTLYAMTLSAFDGRTLYFLMSYRNIRPLDASAEAQLRAAAADTQALESYRFLIPEAIRHEGLPDEVKDLDDDEIPTPCDSPAIVSPPPVQPPTTPGPFSNQGSHSQDSAKSAEQTLSDHAERHASQASTQSAKSHLASAHAAHSNNYSAGYAPPQPYPPHHGRSGNYTPHHTAPYHSHAAPFGYAYGHQGNYPMHMQEQPQPYSYEHYPQHGYAPVLNQGHCAPHYPQSQGDGGADHRHALKQEQHAHSHAPQQPTGNSSQASSRSSADQVHPPACSDQPPAKKRFTPAAADLEFSPELFETSSSDSERCSGKHSDTSLPLNAGSRKVASTAANVIRTLRIRPDVFIS